MEAHKQTYDFIQDECNLTITTRVPSQTSAKDVKVSVQADRLVVSVAGHARQPNLIDGELFYDVDPESLEWQLTGSGNARALVLTLEKAEPCDWDEGLFRRDTVDEAPQPDVARDWMPAAAPGAGSAPAPAARPAAAPAPAIPASSPSGRARINVMDYTRFDRLELSDDDEQDENAGSRRDRPPLALGGEAGRIWSELMSGEKKLLTKDGVVAAVKPAAAVDEFCPRVSDEARRGVVRRHGNVD